MNKLLKVLAKTYLFLNRYSIGRNNTIRGSNPTRDWAQDIQRQHQ